MATNSLVSTIGGLDGPSFGGSGPPGTATERDRRDTVRGAPGSPWEFPVTWSHGPEH